MMALPLMIHGFGQLLQASVPPFVKLGITIELVDKLVRVS